MTLAEYYEFTTSTAVYPKDREEEYLQLGLLSEAGEVAGLLKRRVRDSVTDDKEQMLKELGNCLGVTCFRCLVAVAFTRSSLAGSPPPTSCSRLVSAGPVWRYPCLPPSLSRCGDRCLTRSRVA